MAGSRPRAAAAAASAPSLPVAVAAAGHPEGRAPALARLEQAWADAVSGALRLALVSGEPGIGKTTLAGELARRAHAQGGAVLLGRSDEHALVPFQPWIEVLERLLEALPAADVDHWLTAHDGALARLLPARSAAQTPAGGPRERYLAFELVCALLDDVAARWPVLLVLDDVHWADADSLSLLRHLARSAPRRRLLVVLCARSAELEPAVTQTLAELRREGPLVHVELAGLDEDAVAALLARRTGASDHESARRYRARSGGNPFFLDELLREAQEAGRDVEGPPAGVRDVIARRLARLDDSTLRALDVAAVCGLEFDVTTLARVDDRPVVEVLEALDGAIEAALVAATDRRGRYAFAHALVGETIVCALPASRRARLHLQIADVLADRHDAGEVGAGEVVRHLRARRGAGQRRPPGGLGARRRPRGHRGAGPLRCGSALRGGPGRALGGTRSRAWRGAARARPRSRPRRPARTGPRRVRRSGRARPHRARRRSARTRGTRPWRDGGRHRRRRPRSPCACSRRRWPPRRPMIQRRPHGCSHGSPSSSTTRTPLVPATSAPSPSSGRGARTMPPPSRLR